MDTGFHSLQRIPIGNLVLVGSKWLMWVHYQMGNSLLGADVDGHFG